MRSSGPSLIHLLDVPIFAGLSERGRTELQATASLRTYDTGSAVVRRGEPGRFFYAVAAGAVAVQMSSRQQLPAVWLGRGETFGEMSLISDEAVSATVTAVRDCFIFAIPKTTFDSLFTNEPSFRKAIAEVLAARLRKRTADQERPPSCAFIVSRSPSSLASLVSRAIARGVDHYARAVELEATEASLESFRGRRTARRARGVQSAWLRVDLSERVRRCGQAHLRPNDV
jgi:CRP-like cAMP-binding protein